MKQPFIVGIDLGTSHTVVGFAPDPDAEPRIFPVPQLVARSEIEPRPLCASCLYAPVEDELPATLGFSAGTPPPGSEGTADAAVWIVGELARRRGAEVPARFVASAKSWLCHPSVDRHAPILPYGDEDTSQPRLSPVAASALVLAHVQGAWDAAHADRTLRDQDVVLTVPASFDQVARELTVEAATSIGLRVRLLEEPQAAFYDYMRRAGDDGLRALLLDAPGGARDVLVCDVGGGTTNLSLLRVEARDAAPNVQRVAVGHHLLLGGDNMDLALAHLCERRLVAPPARLPPRRFAELALVTRGAKELLLGDGSSPEDAPVTLLARGSQLLGGTLSTRLTRDDVESTVIDGFFPIVSATARPERRGGLVAFGLPYERDVAITRHVAAFLARHRPASDARTPPGPLSLLLNGGVFRAERIVERIQQFVAQCTGTERADLLPLPEPDLAVALGAVVYGQRLRGGGRRIQGGAARGYYVAVGSRTEGAARTSLVCVVPRGAEEGVRHVAPKPLALLTGKPARFELYASDTARHEPGDVVELDVAPYGGGGKGTEHDDIFDAHPPLVTRIPAVRDPARTPKDRTSHPAQNAGREVTVQLEGELTSIGTLEVSCVERAEEPSASGPASGASGRRHRLAFELRAERPRSDHPGPTSMAPASGRAPSKLQHARELVAAAYAKDGAPASGTKIIEAKDLVRELEKQLGERVRWTVETARGLADELIANRRARRRAPETERVFWQLLGFCMRPGFGHPLDPERMGLVVPLFRETLAFQGEVRSWQQFWIAWRRIAGGVPEAAQLEMRQACDPFIAPTEAKLKKPKGVKPDSFDDLFDFLGSLERTPPQRKSELGGWILERTWTDRDPRLWASIGRLGARVPVYASIHHVVHGTVAERWLDHLLRDKWADLPTAPRAARDLARRTGDRARDVSEHLRAQVEKRLIEAGAPASWVESVREVCEVGEAERVELFGEGLPVGLRWV